MFKKFFFTSFSHSVSYLRKKTGRESTINKCERLHPFLPGIKEEKPFLIKMVELSRGIGTLKITEDDVTTTATDLFSKPSYEVSILEGTEVAFSAENVDSVGPYRITLIGNDEQFIDVKNLHMLLTVSCTKGNGTALEVADEVAYVNNIGGSFFDSVQVAFNGKGVSELTQEEYAYKSYLELLLGYGYESLLGHMSTGGFLMDTHDFDDFQDEESYKIRKEWAFVKKQFFFPLSIDCLQVDRYLPPNISLTLTFHRKPNAFSLLSKAVNANFKIQVHEMKIFANYVTLVPQMRLAIEKQWEVEEVRLPFSKTEVFVKQIAAGLTEANVENCFQGFLPKTVVVGLLDARALDGNYGRNPFNFQHFNATNVHLRVNNCVYPGEPYEMNFADGLVGRVFKEFLNATGLKNLETGTLMTEDRFKNGVTLYAFDLTPDRCNGYHLHPTKRGTLDIKVKFGAALPQGIALMAFACIDRELVFDKARNASVLYL